MKNAYKQTIIVASIAAILAGGSTRFSLRQEGLAEAGDPSSTTPPITGKAPSPALAKKAAIDKRAAPVATSLPDLPLAIARNHNERKLPNQLLQALRTLEPGGLAVNSPATQQAAHAMRLARIPERYIDGDRIRVDITAALPVEKIDNPVVRQPYIEAMIANLRREGIEAQALPASGALQASVPLAKLRRLAEFPEVGDIGLMTLAYTTADASPPTRRAINISEGVAASGAFNPHGVGITGEGVTVGVIDTFTTLDISFSQTLKGLVQTGDLAKDFTYLTPNLLGQYSGTRISGPIDSHLMYFGDLIFGRVDPERLPHGQAVSEIVHDMAPEAATRAYEVASLSAIPYLLLKGNPVPMFVATAIGDAANLTQDARGEWIGNGPPRAQVLNMSLGLLGGAGDGVNGTEPIRAVYKALKAARENGSLSIAAAGNDADGAWFAESTNFSGWSAAPGGASDVYLSWNGAGEKLNKIARGQCTTQGVSVSLTWNDWRRDSDNDGIAENITNTDYAFELYRLTPKDKFLLLFGASEEWKRVQVADNDQSGAWAWAVPVEQLNYQHAGDTSPGCPAGQALYALAVRKKSPSASNAIRVITQKSPLQFSTGAGELATPADSPDARAVAAVDVLTQGLESYSSRGGVLTVGGDRWDSTVKKPEFASFARNSTATYGLRVSDSRSGFGGTSAAAPHVAGQAALLMQLFATEKTPEGTVKTSKALVDNVDEAMRFLAERHDAGAPGFDTAYGYGILKTNGYDLLELYKMRYGSNWKQVLNQALAQRGAAPIP